MQVVDSWVRVALAIIPQMERAAVNTRIVPFALARSQTHGHTVQGRLMCCALLGAAACKLHREDIEHQFLQKAVALCQVCNLPLSWGDTAITMWPIVSLMRTWLTYMAGRHAMRHIGTPTAPVMPAHGLKPTCVHHALVQHCAISCVHGVNDAGHGQAGAAVHVQAAAGTRSHARLRPDGGRRAAGNPGAGRG